MANDTTDFQNAFAAAVETWRTANFPGMTVVSQNGPAVNETDVGRTWVDTEVRWYGASDVTVGGRTLGRHTGTLSLQVYHRSGEGTTEANLVLDSLIELFRSRRLALAILSMPQRSVPTDLKGWHKVGIFVPFRLDSR